MQPKLSEIERIIQTALIEDIGEGDITSTLTIQEGSQAKFFIRAREEMLVCGAEFAAMVFSKVASKNSVTTEVTTRDGEIAKPNDVIISGYGDARAIMAGERTALNLLRQMCGVANKTREFVDKVSGLDAKILDTRKTIPGLRSIQKYAVTVGGGHNHRFGLYDGILIKDNHIAICGGVEEALRMARKHLPSMQGMEHAKVEIECDAIYQVKEALIFGADMILLDNMGIDKLKEAVDIVNKKVPLEASGGVNIDTVRAIAQTGVDFVSVGSITNNPANLDIGLDME